MSEAKNESSDEGATLERLVMRGPKDKTERMFAALNSTVNDLYPNGNGRVYVTGKNIDGEIIYLGEVDESMLYMAGVNPMYCIDHIRFGA